MIPKYKPPPRNLRESRLARFQAALEGLEPDEAEHLALLRDAIVSVQKREHPNVPFGPDAAAELIMAEFEKHMNRTGGRR